jgi:acyl-coenzyme A synthetase/AMP-(fatty) acid ligase
MRPKVILYSATPIPRTHTGKIQRRKLHATFAPYKDCRGALKIEKAP